MLRAWRREDIEQISEIEKRCFPKGAWTKEQIEQSFLTDNFYSALIEEDKIKAYLGAVLNQWEAEIAFIAVDLSYRREGLATKLLNELKDFALKTGREKIFLEVRQSNTQAINLYIKNGFKIYNQRKNYYEGQEDGICMVFELNG